MYSLQILQALAILGAAAAGSNENSDVCVTASAYDGTATSPISGCTAGTTGCSSSGYYECDTGISLVKTAMFASNISACSDAYLAGDGYTTEADYTQLFSACCSDGIGPCDPDHSTMCADPTQYDGSASSSIEGCTPGTSVCDASGYWTCDGVADVYLTIMSSDWADCSAAIVEPSDPDSATWAEMTFVLRARAPARARNSLSLSPRPGVCTSGNISGALAVVRAIRSAARTSAARRPRPPCRASSRASRSSRSPRSFERRADQNALSCL